MRRNTRSGFVLALVVAAAFSVLAGPVTGQAQKASRPEFNLTIAGDAIIVTPPEARENDPGFMGVVKALKEGDASVLNFEGTFATSAAAYPVYDTGGTWIASDPARLKGLQWMGFNLFNASNNHSVDLGVPSLLDTVRTFKAAGATYAGIGENLALAQAPGYLNTHNGRVALVSRASTFSASAPAGMSRPDMRGRPGLAPLRHDTVYRVDAATFDALQKMQQDLKLGGRGAAGATRTTMSLEGGRYGGGAVTFEKSDKPGVVTTADKGDLKAYIETIKDAKQMANYVVTYTHAHEASPAALDVAAQFVQEYAHAAIDAGADVWAASGPHVLRGIEIYKGKPIVYSLGNFIFENDLVLPQPADIYESFKLGPEALPAAMYNARSDFDRRTWPANPLMWETAVVKVTFRDGVPALVTLTPVSLGYGQKRVDRGYPKLADLKLGTKILEDFQRLSTPFGTKITIKDGIGTIVINQGGATAMNVK